MSLKRLSSKENNNNNVPIKKSKEETKGNKNKQANNELLQEIECPVCTFVMCDRILQCCNGHSICFKCKENVSLSFHDKFEMLM